MANIQVKQLDFRFVGVVSNNSKLRRDVSYIRGEELARLVLANKDKLLTVYSGLIDCKSGTELDTAYRMTNTVDEAWYKSASVLESGTVDLKGEDGCRSTSIGDVIVVEGVTFMVDGYGFICLDDVDLEVA